MHAHDLRYIVEGQLLLVCLFACLFDSV